jgi:hypothetical protein
MTGSKAQNGKVVNTTFRGMHICWAKGGGIRIQSRVSGQDQLVRWSRARVFLYVGGEGVLGPNI